MAGISKPFGHGIIFVDELLDGLDPEYVEIAMQVVRYIESIDIQLLMTSHDSTIKGHLSTIWTTKIGIRKGDENED